MNNNQPIPASNTDSTRRDLLIIFGIFIVLCLVAAGVGAAGFFLYQDMESESLAQSTAAVATQVYALEMAKITQQAEAKATLQAAATAQAQATVQAATRATAIAGSEVFEPFNDNAREWRVGEEDSEFWQGSIAIENGAYVWNVANAKQGFISWGDPDNSPIAGDFDVYVDARLVAGDSNQVCYGLVYYATRDILDDGAITFSACDTQDINIEYFSNETNWETVLEWTVFEPITPGGWNQLAVTRRGAAYSFFINDQLAATVNETRLTMGYLSMFVTVYDAYPGEVWFDNFALQPR